MINGIINVYKEKDFTSHDVIAKLRGILKQKKIGHTGTLDPQATGVLPVCLGKGTKLCDMLTDRDKEYEAVMLLGKTTDTEDTTGKILTENEVDVTDEEITQTVMSFLGSYAQIPPMYSALKVNGKKLYDYARAGIEIERKSREVTIYEIKIVSIEQPRVTFRVRCSKGTYIRTLCKDIGEKLGCGACMDELKRTMVGRFELKDALTLSQIEEYVKNGNINQIVHNIDEMFEHLNRYVVSEKYNKFLYNGNALKKEWFTDDESVDSQIRIYDCKGEFYGIYSYNKIRDEYKPDKIFYDNEAG